MGKAKYKAYGTFYARLCTKDVENVIYKLPKAKERKMWDLGSVWFIKR